MIKLCSLVSLWGKLGMFFLEAIDITARNKDVCNWETDLKENAESDSQAFSYGCNHGEKATSMGK